MAFESQAWSCETLCRGLEVVSGMDMSSMADPDQAEMEAELNRLEERNSSTTSTGRNLLLGDLVISTMCFEISSFATLICIVHFKNT